MSAYDDERVPVERTSAAEAVGGFLAAASIALSAVAVVYRPVRLVPFALVIAFIAVGLTSGRHARLAAFAVGVGATRLAGGDDRRRLDGQAHLLNAAPRGAFVDTKNLMSVHDVDGMNVGYARGLFEEYLENPEAVPAEWRAVFESGDPELLQSLPGLARLLETLRADGDGVPPPAPAPPAEEQAPPPEPAPAAAPEAVDHELLGAVAAAASLIKAHRTHGHLAAHLDPLGSEPVGDPALEPELLVPKLTPELQARIPASVLRVGMQGETLADVLPRIRETYCGTIAYEIEHISDHQERVWLRQAIESGRYRSPLTDDEKKRMLARLTEVEGFEHYLRRAFLGQKQFSIEGLDVMVPMLDESLSLAAEAGAHEVVIGMAHRGRLNVLAHIIGRPYEELLREFEGERTIEAVTAKAEGASGDVKYHLGAVGRRPTSAGELTVSLAANPSHLEAVDPVVEGITRAEQTDRAARAAPHDPSVALPVLIHGDASFPGQGVVAETLNLQGLIGYTTGGTLHLIANNQVGFTTDPADGRSTRYSSDLAKGFDIPIIHVNADDPQAAIWAIRLALAFRRRFGQRRRRRSRRLPPARPQRGGRSCVHAAAHGPADRRAAVCARPVRRGARRRRDDHA